MNEYQSRIFTILLTFSLVIATITFLSIVFPERAHALEKTTAQMKIERLTSIGFKKDVASSLVMTCKEKAKNPVHCIKIGASIMWAESSMGWACTHNNCTGMNDGGKHYTSISEWVRHWVQQYNRYWFRQVSPYGFYRMDGLAPATHYCMWPKNDGVCVNGYRNSWKVWNSLLFSF